MNEMDEYAKSLIEWNATYEAYLKANEINEMFVFFAKHCPHKDKFVYVTDRRWAHEWTPIEKKLNKPFPLLRYSKLGGSYRDYDIIKTYGDIRFTESLIPYKNTWYPFPSTVYLKNAVIPKWLAYSDGARVRMRDTFDNIRFYLENCVVPEGILPSNITIL
jgi:hypothetical protein